MMYVQALQTDPGGFVDALVKMLLPLALGWLALIVLLFGETRRGVRQHLLDGRLAPEPRAAAEAAAAGAGRRRRRHRRGHQHRPGAVRELPAADRRRLRAGVRHLPRRLLRAAPPPLRGRAAVRDVRARTGTRRGSALSAIAVWVCGFFLYAFAAQPPWLLEHLDFVSWAPAWMTHVGGTIPASSSASAAYWLAARYLLLR